MFSLRRPTDATVAELRDRGVSAPWSYAEVGATRNGVAGLPDAVTRRNDVDHNTALLGLGRAVFDRASAAVLAWRCFDMPWLELHGGDSPARVGQVVATMLRTLGIWATNPCRVVYVIGGPDESDRTGFAYGTLAGHAERGEERFLVEHDRRSDRVTFEILAFSQPDHVLARIGKPHTRALQRRFARSALAAMQRAATG